MKKTLLIVLIGLAFCGLSVQAAPIKQGVSPESAVTVKEHHPGGGPAGHGGGPAMRGGGPAMHGGRIAAAPARPAPHHRHHHGTVAPFYVGVGYTSPAYYDPYYYGYYYDPYYYTYPVRPVVRYRVPNVGFSVMF